MDESTKPVVPILGQTNREAIEVTRKVLAMLEKGEMISVAIVGEKSDGNIGVWDALGEGRLVTMLGAASMLMRRIQDYALERAQIAKGMFAPRVKNGS